MNVVLKWDSAIPLTYTTKTFSRYKHPKKRESILPERLKNIVRTLEKTRSDKHQPLEDEWISTDEVKDNLSIVLAFDIPEFVEKSKYNISGVINYKFKEKNCQLSIPNLEILARDLASNLFVVKSFDVISGAEEAYLSTLIANEESELVVRTSPHAYTTLEHIMEIECIFRKVNIPSSTKKFLYVDNIAGSTDGYLFVFKKDTETLYNMSVFSRDQTSFQLILHFLYQNISDILILPKRCKDTLVDTDIFSLSPAGLFTQTLQQPEKGVNLKSTLKDFGKILESQIDLVEKFCTKRLDELPEEIVEDKDEVDLEINIQDYQQFRRELADLELTSDLLFAKIEKVTVKSEDSDDETM